MLFLLAPLVLSGIAVAAVAVFWNRILNWSEDHLTPWLTVNAPQLIPYVRNAFAALDESMVTIRKAAKEAWQYVRELLLKQTAEFVRTPTGTWVGRFKSWLLDPQGSGRVHVRETEREVAYDELPEDVRREWLQRGTTGRIFDITQLRDHEVMAQNA